MLPDNRLIFGGRGDITGRSDDPSVYAKLERQLAETFPAIADVGVRHRWSGKVAITLDDFPHIGRLSPRVAYAMGYGGAGSRWRICSGSILRNSYRVRRWMPAR